MAIRGMPNTSQQTIVSVSEPDAMPTPPVISIPDVTISATTPHSQQFPFRDTTAQIRFGWTEPVSAFDIADPNDVTFVNSGADAVSLSNVESNSDNTVFTAAMTLPQAQGNVIITVLADSAEGNTSTGPNGDRSLTFYYDTRPQARAITGATVISTITKTIDEGVFNGAMESIAHGGYLYVVAQVMHDIGSMPTNFIDYSAQAGAVLYRVGISTGTVLVLKMYAQVSEAARSFCVHDGMVHFIEGLPQAYNWNDQVLDDTERSNWKSAVGYVFRINGTTLERVGINWRSVFENPEDENDRYYGIHGGTFSPMLSATNGTETVLSMITGYGETNYSDVIAVDSVFAEKGNWQWVQYGNIHNTRVDALQTNEKTALTLLQDLAAITFTTIGVTPDAAFFMRHRGAREAQLDGGITATDTTLTFSDANRESIPDSGLLLIDDEIITYAGRNNLVLSGLERNQFKTTAATHADGTALIWVDYALQHPDPRFRNNPIKTLNVNTEVSQLYNRIVISYGDDQRVVRQDDASIAANGERELSITAPLASYQQVWAKWLADQYLSLLSTPRKVVEMTLLLSPYIQPADVAYIREPSRTQFANACLIVEVDHNFQSRETRVKAITI